MNGLDLGAARFSNVSNLLTMPIFDWGRTRAINEIAGSGQNEAVLRYEDAIVRALEDVENALVALHDQRIRAEALQGAAASADAALGHAQSLYNRGQIDLLPLLDAQRTRLNVRVSANDSNTRLLLATRRSVQGARRRLAGLRAGRCTEVGQRGPSASFRNPGIHQRGSVVKASIGTALIAATIASLLSACSHEAPPAETLRPVRTVEVQYERAREASRYFGSVQARHEVDQAFRVGGKVLERRVDVGQSVREGDVLAVLDDVDYRLSEEAARQQLEAATARARQAESDWQRMQALKLDGSVSEFDDEHAQSTLLTARAAAEAEARKLELARNQVKYTVLRASSSGVVTSVRFEVGQVVAAGQPVISDCEPGRARDRRGCARGPARGFQDIPRFMASLASAPEEKFEVVLRELSAQAAAQTRTYRARLKPATPRATAARRDGNAGHGARDGWPAVGVHPGRRDHAEQGAAGAVDRSSAQAMRRSESLNSRRLQSMDTATTRCSCPVCPPGRSSSLRACRRWLRDCASRCPPMRTTHAYMSRVAP